MRSNPSKLSEDEKREVCKQFGEFRTPSEIADFVRANYGKSILPQSLAHYVSSKKHGEIIRTFRQEWAVGVMAVPIAHKRYRLEQLMDIYQTQKDNMGHDNGLTDPERYHLMLSCLRDAKGELDEAKTHVTNMYLTQINELSDEELKKKRDMYLERLEDMRRKDASEITSTTTVDGDSGARTAEVVRTK